MVCSKLGRSKIMGKTWFIMAACVVGSATLAFGTHEGYVYERTKPNIVRGVVTMTVKETVSQDKKTGTSTTTSKITAKAIMQHATLSLSGQFVTEESRHFILKASTGESLTGYFDGGKLDIFYGTFAGGKHGIDIFDVKGGQQGQRPSLQGLYNVALDEVRFGGGGHLSLTVGSTGTVKIAGKLSDGTSMSGSATLVRDAEKYDEYFIILYKPLYSRKGYVGGVLRLSDDFSKGITGKVFWICDDSKWWQELEAIGGYYGNGRTAPQLPQNGMVFYTYMHEAYLPSHSGVVGDWVAEAFPLMQTSPQLKLPKASPPKKYRENCALCGVTPTKSKWITWYEYGGANPSSATLSFTSATGVDRKSVV